MVATLGTAPGSAINPERTCVVVGGYYYEFWYRQSDSYLVYRSSTDGETWGNTIQASATALTSSAYGDWSVETDGTSIIIGYTTGTYGTGSNVAYMRSRKGTPSEGTISWNSAILVLTAGTSFFPICLVKSGSTWYMSTHVYTAGGPGYRIHIFKSTDGETWSSILAGGDSVDGNNKRAATICKWNTSYTDGLILVYQCSVPSGVWRYYTYDGTNWSSVNNFASGHVTIGAGYDVYSIVYADGKVHFVWLNNCASPYNGNIKHASYDSSWSSVTTVDSNTNTSMSLACTSDYLIAIFYRSPDIRFRKYIFSTSTWDDEQTWIRGETSPYGIIIEKAPASVTTGAGLTWRAGSSSPYNINSSLWKNAVFQSCSFTLNVSASKIVTPKKLRTQTLGISLSCLPFFQRLFTGEETLSFSDAYVINVFTNKLESLNFIDDIFGVPWHWYKMLTEDLVSTDTFDRNWDTFLALDQILVINLLLLFGWRAYPTATLTLSDSIRKKPQRVLKAYSHYILVDQEG